MTTLTTYIGTKIIQAVPENASNCAEGYRMIYANGYTSWSPKEAFEEAYRPTDRMTFGDALVMLKKGVSVKRENWPPGCFLVMSDGAMFYQAGPTRMSLSHGIHVYEADMLAEDWQVVE